MVTVSPGSRALMNSAASKNDNSQDSFLLDSKITALASEELHRCIAGAKR